MEIEINGEDAPKPLPIPQGLTTNPDDPLCIRWSNLWRRIEKRDVLSANAKYFAESGAYISNKFLRFGGQDFMGPEELTAREMKKVLPKINRQTSPLAFACPGEADDQFLNPFLDSWIRVVQPQYIVDACPDSKQPPENLEHYSEWFKVVSEHLQDPSVLLAAVIDVVLGRPKGAKTIRSAVEKATTPAESSEESTQRRVRRFTKIARDALSNLDTIDTRRNFRMLALASVANSFVRDVVMSPTVVVRQCAMPTSGKDHCSNLIWILPKQGEPVPGTRYCHEHPQEARDSVYEERRQRKRDSADQ